MEAGITEWLLIAAIFIILFGPAIGRWWNRAHRGAKKAQKAAKRKVKNAVYETMDRFNWAAAVVIGAAVIVGGIYLLVKHFAGQ